MIGRRQIILFCFTCALGAYFPPLAAAQTTESGDDLSAVVSEIASMQKNQLLKFKEYLAECHTDLVRVRLANFAAVRLVPVSRHRSYAKRLAIQIGKPSAPGPRGEFRAGN